MGSKYKKTSLKELGVELIDCDHKTPKAVESGVPYIGIPQMDNGRINFDANPRLISEKDFVTWTRKANPKFGDVILSRRCNSGETVYVPKDAKFALGQNLVLLRPTGDRIHPEFLRWVVQGLEWWNEVAKYLNPGAIFESLKCRDIPKFQIPEPSKEQQIKISEVLSSISDKIELNQQINQTLEQMAQTLFKSWFVDFDPVFDNLLAKANYQLDNLPADFPEELRPKAVTRLAALSARIPTQAHENERLASGKESDNATLPHPDFPSKFEFIEQLGWVPLGWECGGMSSHSLIEMGQSPKGDTYNTDAVGTALVNGPVEFGPYFAKKSKWTTAPTKLSQKGDLIVCVRGSTTGRLVKADDVYCLGRGVCSVRGKLSQVFSDQLFKKCIKEMLGLTTGSTFPNWSRQTLSEFKVIIPTETVIKMFDNFVSPNISKIEASVSESESLTKLRDTLLPKLISGEIIINRETV